MLPALHSERQRVKRIISIVDSLPRDNELLRSEWAKYVTIVCCGYLEEAARIILREYARTRSQSTIHKYVSGKLQEFHSPRPEALEQLLRAFEPRWAESLATYWEEERRNSLTSIVNNRNHAAHGRHFGTSLSAILGYYRDVDDIVMFVHEMVLGPE
jgi:hypothetical protein